MYIREKGPLPAIIVAPLLKDSYSAFPNEYLDGVLGEIQKDYRVDPGRTYLTGLSMGGEASYRFAVRQPQTFAAVAPVAAFVNQDTYDQLAKIKGIPVWAVHGADDPTVPLSAAQRPVDALKALGADIKFTVLPNHDHDAWTDTYSDKAFYDWLLSKQKP